MKNDYPVKYLYTALKDTLHGLGASDEKIKKNVEAAISDMFEKYICEEDGNLFRVADGDVVYCFDGSKYERIDDVIFKIIIKRVMEKLEVGMVYQKGSYKTIFEQCSDKLLVDERKRFVPDRRYVYFNNCVLDTVTGELKEQSLQYETDIILDFDYKPDYVSPLWDRVLAETIPDAGMRTAFQQFCGAWLADRTKFKIEHMCLMVGTGRNGKSLICKAVADVFGDRLVSSYSPEQLFKSSQSTYNLADINGKIANYADDVSNKDISGGDFKQFVSGAKFQARHIYGRPFVVSKIPLMLMCCNEIPMSTDDTNGYYRRLLPIICPNQIKDEDVDYELPGKLATPESKAAIFNWLYDGLKQIIANKGRIDVCETIKNISNDIKEDSNSARRWVREMGLYAVTPTGKNDPRWKTMQDWMRRYLEYCTNYSEPPKTKKGVGQVFADMHFAKERRNNGMWYCIGVKSDEDGGFNMDDEDDNIPF